MTGNVSTSTGFVICALRLSPGTDVKEHLQAFTQAQGISAGCIVTAVGSLRQASLRFAGQEITNVFKGQFEIASLTGTLCPDGLHLHIAISDPQGHTLGGHVMPGCLVYTTAEIMVGVLSGIQFQRVHDPETGYRELKVNQH